MTRRVKFLSLALVILLAGGGFQALQSGDLDGLLERGISRAEAAATPPRDAFEEFFAEAGRVNKAVDCGAPRFIAGDDLVGELYSCVLGDAETAKVFINAYQGDNQVANVKIMWNDWTADVGFGTHADEEVALSTLAAVVDLYAPELTERAILAFMEDQPVEFISGPYYMRYRVAHGPKIDERLLTIEQR